MKVNTKQAMVMAKMLASAGIETLKLPEPEPVIERRIITLTPDPETREGEVTGDETP